MHIYSHFLRLFLYNSVISVKISHWTFPAATFGSRYYWHWSSLFWGLFRTKATW